VKRSSYRAIRCLSRRVRDIVGLYLNPPEPLWRWPPAKSLSSVIAQHRAVEFRQFLETVEAATPPTLDVHLVMDNYGTQNAAREALVCSTPELPLAIYAH
jgi:hypothetical protein